LIVSISASAIYCLERLAAEMTWNVLSGGLNFTYLLSLLSGGSGGFHCR